MKIKRLERSEISSLLSQNNKQHKTTHGVGVSSKAMHWPEISVIPCFAKIDLTGIPTNGILTELNCTSETGKFRGNLMEIITEMFNENITGNNRPIHSKPS